MHTKPTIEPGGSAVHGVIREPVHVGHEADAADQRRSAAGDAAKPAGRYGRRSLARRLLVKFVAAIRGDKYMANAYPPAWRGDADPVGLRQNDNDNASAAVQSSITAPSSGTTYRPTPAPAPAGIEER